jgi:hypothetical protein
MPRAVYGWLEETMRRLMILAFVLAVPACTSTPQTAQMSPDTTCRAAADGTTVCQPVTYQKRVSRYSK